MHALGPPVSDFLLNGSAAVFKPRPVEKGAQRVCAGHPKHDGRRVRHVPEPLLALALSPFRRLLLQTSHALTELLEFGFHGNGSL